MFNKPFFMALVCISIFPLYAGDMKVSVNFSAEHYEIMKDYPAAITVTVTDDQGQPLKDRTVQVSPQSDLFTVPTASGKSDANGHAVFAIKTGDKPGSIKVLATVTENANQIGESATAKLVEKIWEKYGISADYDVAQAKVGSPVNLTVTITQSEVAKVGVEVDASITGGKGVFKNKKAKTSGTTNTEGKVSFQITPSAAGHLTVLIRPKNSKDEETFTIDTVKYEDGLGSSRVRTDLILGTTFHNKYDENGKAEGFEDTSRFAQLSFDTLWRRDKKFKVHTGVVIRMSSFPVTPSTDDDPNNNQTNPDGTENTNFVKDTFSEFSDSIVGGLYFNGLPANWCSYSKTNRDPEKPYDVFRFGYIVKASFISRDNIADNEDTLISDYGAGFTFVHYKSKADSAEKDTENEVPMRYISVTYDRFEEYGDEHDEGRLLITAAMRLNTIGGTNGLPFHGGIHANVGKGPDDLRIFAGFRFGLDRLVDMMR